MENSAVDRNLLKIRTQSRLSGCILTFVAILGIFLLCSGILAISFSQDLESKLIGIFISFLGFISAYAGFFSPMKGFQEEIIIDKLQNFVKIQNNRNPANNYTILFQEINHFHCLQTYGSSGRSRVPIHAIYLLKNDGAEVFIYSNQNKKDFLNKVNEILDFTGFACRDSSDLGLTREAVKSYQENGSQRFDSREAPSAFIERTVPDIASTMNKGYYSGDTFRLKPYNRSIAERIVVFLVFAFFISMPLGFGYQAIFEEGAPKIFLLFFIPFILIFLSVTFFVILLSFKDYLIALEGGGIRIRLIFRSKILSKFNKDIYIPRDKVEFVRVNRGDNGFFWLALGIKEDFVFNGNMQNLLFGLGAFKKENLSSKLIRKERVISLWEVPHWHRPGKGPGLTDLLSMENIIEKKLNLEEKKI